ncbi:MAG: hypothetical protein JWQ19_3037 [Subtercola sp.]|nr:hypothetical protein [Subtercola sp.]
MSTLTPVMPESPAEKPNDGRSVLELRSIRKAFGPTVAVKDATFQLRAGEVHAIVGENGSGKSTLVKILSGIHEPDSGEIVIEGTVRSSFARPGAALKSGIATVFQEVLVVESQTVVENLWLGSDGFLASSKSKRAKRAEGATALADLLENPPQMDVLVEDLSLSDRQACGIARAILRRPKVLILDEATSALDFDTRSRLFTVVRRLASEGVGIILITHRMDEIEDIADRLTVLRSGQTIATLDGDNWTTPQLVQLMTGAEALVEPEQQAVVSATELGAVVLEARDIRLTPSAEPFTFSIRAGELVGLAGLEGQGQDTFLRALWGFGTSGGEVVRMTGGSEMHITSNASASRAGIAYVPRERRAESIFEWMSIQENFSLPTSRQDRRGPFLSNRASASRFTSYISRLNIKLGKPSDGITTLSGGNQQKVIVARWLASNPEVLLLNDPTRGIDINAKRDLYALLRTLASEGLAVVMLSTEVDEHIELMHRVLVFHDDQCSREFTKNELGREALVASFFGSEVEVAS